MPFKIVQTVENGVARLTIVPEYWEAKGVLWWPPKNFKYSSKFIKDENSRPSQGWIPIKCVIKRQKIRTYEEGLHEVNRMEQNTDTDFTEQEDESNSRYYTPLDISSTLNSGSRNKNTNLCFETMAQTLSHPPAGSETSKEDEQNILGTVQVFSTEEIESVKATQNEIISKLDVVLNNQKKIAHKLASFSVQLEETNARITNLLDLKEQPVTLLKDAAEENESFSIKAIETLAEFQSFELNLADKTQAKKISNFLSILCSSSPGNGTTCAYKLLDVLFTRDFLCQCSWSGGSKGETSKIPLKNFTNFRKFFFKIVHTWDPQFTDDEMVKFFKQILRNALKRKSMKGLRASAKRTRKFKKQETGEDNDNAVRGDGGNPSEANGDGIVADDVDPEANGDGPEANGDNPEANGDDPEANSDTPEANGDGPEANDDDLEANGNALEANDDNPGRNE